MATTTTDREAVTAGPVGLYAAFRLVKPVIVVIWRRVLSLKREHGVT